MIATRGVFNEEHTLRELRHYLPAQAPLKDFIHHNTLHAFQHHHFSAALKQAADVFGYKTRLTLEEYRTLFYTGKIDKKVFARVLAKHCSHHELDALNHNMLLKSYASHQTARIGKLRSHWKERIKIDLDNQVHPLLFRVLCSYLDQGIAIWEFPEANKSFLAAIAELEKHSVSGIFRKGRAKDMLLNGTYSIKKLLQIIVGNEAFFEQYLFDQQFAHQGWSGMVAAIEAQPETILDTRTITLADFIVFELLLELDAIDFELGMLWKPLSNVTYLLPTNLFAHQHETELDKLLRIWQEAYEWSYYDEVLRAIKVIAEVEDVKPEKSFQALFCIDDRECSIRRHLELIDEHCETFGTPGFFGVEFYYQPENGKFITKVCPAPITPKYLIRETESTLKHAKDMHLNKQTHSLLSGWLISQTIGFWSAFRLVFQIFKPSMSPATATSFRHMDQFSKLTIEHEGETDATHNLQIGFTVDEMTTRTEGLLKSIGLVDSFAPIVYIVGHGSSSVNNPHYAAYDCGACSGRPGSVNARVAAFMANHKLVRKNLLNRGIAIPESTLFVAALHDTTRDEVMFYDEDKMGTSFKSLHAAHKLTFEKALEQNAKERSRRFDVINTQRSAKAIHQKIKKRSVSLFEPRPELNHATNALCVIGRRTLTRHLFLDRRAFMNSYNYAIDPEGQYLLNILKAAAPVCGGINLEYYFSRVDNQKLGAGTKLPHNVMGLIGVANGIDGDLRPGLPSQMIEVHDPIRLMIIVEHYPEVVLDVIKQSPATYEWFENEWVHLVAIDPSNKKQFVFSKGAFHTYQTIGEEVKEADDFISLIESSSENIPVTLIKK